MNVFRAVIGPSIPTVKGVEVFDVAVQTLL